MIVDIHHPIDAATDIYYERSINLGERDGGVVVHLPHADAIEAASARMVAAMDADGIDVQLQGPMPHHLMTAERPPRFVAKWIGNYNTVIAQHCALAPDRLKGLAALSLPVGEPVEACFEELDRCVELGFIGVVLNPDPGEGDGSTPRLSDPFWFPLFERLQALDLPALVSAGGCRDERESYASHWINETDIALVSLLLDPTPLDLFPKLKLIVGYGGGSVPYQIGRWRAHRPEHDIDAVLSRLWFDTVIHTPAAMRLLINLVGADRCLFGTGRLGGPRIIDPATGRDAEDVRHLIDTAPYLSAAQRGAILGGNAQVLFSRLERAA